MATYASKLRSTAVDGQTIRLLPDGRLRGNAGIEPFSAGTKGGAPSVFYVDGNVVSSGNGLGWLSAFKTLAEGLVAAHAYMSTSGNRAWAHRATVYVVGDSLTEDIVLAAEKTDVIGVGSANSHDMVEIIGNHVPATNNTWGMRWYHCQFQEADTGAMWTLQAQESGWKFIDCVFSNRNTNATHGILWTASYNLEVIDCVFDSVNGFTTGAIVIGAGTSDKVLIRNNLIQGSKGVIVNASYTQVAGNIIIDNNVFKCLTLCIDDNSDKAIVTRNMMVSEETIGANMYDFNVALAAGNIATGSDNTLDVPIKAV
ncbi:hypothetical protein LCGC14_0659830 [marine sediment metagenome]|uniref:Right handed beta helix domain-containing protein n=1 Tax=marine sediment metagenome TaxID=412755 RepID=A0A0F9QZ02_9ZZZZ